MSDIDQRSSGDSAPKGRLSRRKTHRKSRLGCTFCKGRRIKCDEKKPSCSNCTCRSLVCSFSIDTQSSQVSSSCMSDDFLRNNQIILDVQDLVLFHHFCSFTSESFSPSKPAQLFWSVSTPKLAFKHRFLLHGILAIAALHINNIEGQNTETRADKLIEKADQHWRMALQLATPLLLDVNRSNRTALFLFATLTCLHTFALGPQENDFLLFNVDGQAEWLLFFRGMRSIELACDDPGVDDGIEGLGQIFSLTETKLDEGNEEDLAPAFQNAFEDLYQCILDDAPDEGPGSEALTQAYCLLRGCYKSVFGSSERAIRPSASIVFAWTYRVSDRYLGLLYLRRPAALALFSFFVVLIKQMDAGWMIKGWPAHLMSGIYNHMPVNHRFSLGWSMARIGWLPT